MEICVVGRESRKQQTLTRLRNLSKVPLNLIESATHLTLPLQPPSTPEEEEGDTHHSLKSPASWGVSITLPASS
jgi:hypothetical protein